MENEKENLELELAKLGEQPLSCNDSEDESEEESEDSNEDWAIEDDEDAD